ncbi:MAG: transposase [Candidatus Poribacteria bacterium]|nr:transposase [Candidatus Poribacteria bacterium]
MEGNPLWEGNPFPDSLQNYLPWQKHSCFNSHNEIKCNPNYRQTDSISSKGVTMNRYPTRGSRQLRKGRHVKPGTYYLLTTSTIDRRPILSNPEVARIIFETFEWLETQDRITWISVIVMPDHIHAVVQLGPNQTLTKIMHSFKMFTARRINEHRCESGSVWQEGYHDHGIRRDESLSKIIRYCYHNPVRRGLVKQARDYPYWRYKSKIE